MTWSVSASCLKGTPRHADVLVCSGPVTRQIKDRLVRIYEQMPEPKFVVAVGTCACSGGVFKGCYNVMDGIDAVIPVSMYIPGCPASPQAIIDGVVKLLASIDHPETKPAARRAQARPGRGKTGGRRGRSGRKSHGAQR